MVDMSNIAQAAISAQDEGYHARITRLEHRVMALEQMRKVELPQGQVRLDMNSNRDAFIKRLLDPSDLGYAVTFEVRNAARRALGLPEVKEYDL